MSAPSTKYYEYFTIGRNPQEIRDLYDWATARLHLKAEHDDAYALGILATLRFLMDNDTPPPQIYKGLFTLENVFAESEKPDISCLKCASCPWRLSALVSRDNGSLMSSRQWMNWQEDDGITSMLSNKCGWKLTPAEGSEDIDDRR